MTARPPWFGLSVETREALSEMRASLDDDLGVLRERWDRQSQRYRDDDEHNIGAWLEAIECILEDVDNLDHDAPDQPGPKPAPRRKPKPKKVKQ